jgi:hypothetical protein
VVVPLNFLESDTGGGFFVLKICADEWIREFQHGSADTRRKTENKEPASYFSGMKGLDMYDLSADFFARFAALRPSKPKPGFHPNTRKPRVLGSPASTPSREARVGGPGLLGAAARGPTA